jgi:CRP-like cAMP-binding protein
MDEHLKELEILNPWFDNLPYQWENLNSYGSVITYKKNQTIFHQNDYGEYIYMVEKGRVRLFLVSPNGEEKALTIIGMNGILGECSLSQDSKYSTSAICASDVVMRRITRKDFISFISKEPEFILQTLDLITRKYRLLCMQSLQLSYMKSLPRICDLLIQLSLKYSENLNNNKVRLTIQFTQQEMANLLGTTRITVAKNMRWLENNDYIIKEGKYYIINDIRELNDLKIE